MRNLGKVSLQTRTYPIPAGALDGSGPNRIAYRCNNNPVLYSGSAVRATLYAAGLPLLIYVGTCP